MTTGSHDESADIPPTDFDDIENQDQEDVVFGRDKPVTVDEPDDD
jgi:hypothetical protein